jgi:hypothetical protein
MREAFCVRVAARAQRQAGCRWAASLLSKQVGFRRAIEPGGSFFQG